MSGHDLDVLVIGGGGSGGFTAATTALKSGARVGMVEAGRLGGLCILAGCMPSKTLLHGAALFKEMGVPGARAYPRLLALKRAVVEHLAGGRQRAVAEKEAQGLTLYRGQAVLVDPHTVQVEGRRLSAGSIIIATGSREVWPPLPGIEGAGCLVAEEFMDLPELPGSLVVLGGGAIACELAQYAARMGVATTLVQRGERLLSQETPRVGQVIQEALEADGARVFTSTELVAVEAGPEGKTVRFKQDGAAQSAQAQAVLLALGRRPNIQGLGLEAAGVAVENGAPKVDRFMRTSVGHIYAAGDVTGQALVVNLAVLQGQIAGYNATHPEPRAIDDRVLPRAVFTDPQVARVGLSAAQARQAGVEFLEVEMDLAGLGVARTYPQELRGFLALRAERMSGRILGAELVAPEASLMIHDLAVAMKLGGTAQDLAEVPYIHPCLAEITNYAAERLAHMLRRG
ncbi:MAG: NAD(P)/FAD-dependent oxidoreductase [Desulfarculus sp.]|nr:NAD(P)/FAD-dependent oxidoreductase [Desulfarculus sp.]